MKLFRNFQMLFLCTILLSPVSCGKNGVSPGSLRNSGKISVQSVPEGALVSIRGTRRGETPLEIGPLTPETYFLTIEKKGFSPRWVKIQVEKNKTTHLRVPLEPLTASVVVTSSPSGAMVSVNGKNRGPAPYILPDLEFGEYEIGVSLPNYLPVLQKLVVPLDQSAPDSPFPLHFNLISNAGSLQITTDPAGADVFLDGAETASGQTPFFLEKIREGQHRVRLRKKGFQPLETTLTVFRNKKAEPPAFRLKPLPGTLVLKVSPADARVELDGNPLNHPLQPISRQPGDYQIRVTKTGYDDVVLKVHIHPEEMAVENIEMSRNTGEVRFVVNPPGVSISIDKRLVGMSQPDPARKNSAREFRISGLSTGKHLLEFTHSRPHAARKEVIFSIDAKGETKTLPAIELWVPNANVEMKKTGRKYRNVRIIETGASSGELLYEPEPGIRMSYRKNEISVEYLPAGKRTDKRFQSSSVNLLELPGGAPDPVPVRNRPPSRSRQAPEKPSK